MLSFIEKNESIEARSGADSSFSFICRAQKFCTKVIKTWKKVLQLRIPPNSTAAANGRWVSRLTPASNEFQIPEKMLKYERGD